MGDCCSRPRNSNTPVFTVKVIDDTGTYNGRITDGTGILYANGISYALTIFSVSNGSMTLEFDPAYDGVQLYTLALNAAGSYSFTSTSPALTITVTPLASSFDRECDDVVLSMFVSKKDGSFGFGVVRGRKFGKLWYSDSTFEVSLDQHVPRNPNGLKIMISPPLFQRDVFELVKEKDDENDGKKSVWHIFDDSKGFSIIIAEVPKSGHLKPDFGVSVFDSALQQQRRIGVGTIIGTNGEWHTLHDTDDDHDDDNDNDAIHSFAVELTSNSSSSSSSKDNLSVVMSPAVAGKSEFEFVRRGGGFWECQEGSRFFFIFPWNSKVRTA